MNVVGVTHGADSDRLRRVAEDVSGSARVVQRVEHEGTSQLGVLLESWVGGDTDQFAADWQAAGPQLAAVADLLSRLARQLVEQAQQQDAGSGQVGAVRGAAPGAAGSDPFRAMADLVPGLFSVKDGDGGYWPDLTAANKPTFGPQTPGWPLLLDKGTDWANDVYVDHIRDNPFSAAPHIVRGLGEGSDWLRDVKDEYLKRKSNPFPFDGPSIFLDVVADTLEDYGKILHDPKGWWDNEATVWDKIGAGISVIPGLGIAAKFAVKATKDVFDVVAKGFKHADDVKTPHVPHGPKKSSVDPDPGSGPDAHDSGNPNKGAGPQRQIGSYVVPHDAVSAQSGHKHAWNRDLYDPKPNTTYLVDDRFVYVTDEHGRVKEAHGVLEDNPRDPARHRQILAGGDDRLPDDQGGHIFGKRTGGPGEDINLVAMSPKTNGSSQYGKLEQEWRDLITADPPSEVVVDYFPVFQGGSERPTSFVIKWSKDGVPQRPRTFVNQ